MKSIFTTLTLLAVALSAQAAAPRGGSGGPPPRGGPPPVPPEVLARFDTDKDGKLSEAERAAMKAALEAERQALIARFDTDGDGVLNETERAALRAHLEAEALAKVTAKFKELDTNVDGSLSLAEFTAGAPAGTPAFAVGIAFKALDKDKNKALSLSEFTLNHRPKPPARK